MDKNLLQIYFRTALILTFFYKISNCQSYSKPRLTTTDSKPVRAIGSTWEIECFCNRVVNWTVSHWDPKRHKLSIGPSGSRDNPHSAGLTIFNVSHVDVQTFKCFFPTGNEIPDPSSLSCSMDNVACVHLFVDDKINLLADYSTDVQILSTDVGFPIVIPCRPTSPHVEIKLYKIDHTAISTTLYVNTEGYTIRSATIQDGDRYTCEGERDKKVERMFFRAYVYEPIKEIPTVRSNRSPNVELGSNFSLNCTLETGNMAPFELKWTDPGSVINSSRAELLSGRAAVPGTHPEKILTWTSLTIQKTIQEDETDFICTMTQMDREKRASISIQIYEPIQENPTVSSNRAINNLALGSSFSLNCTLETVSRSTFELKWIDPASVINSSRAELLSGSTTVTGTHPEKVLTWTSLTITNASQEDDTDFVCTMTHMDSEKRANISIKIDATNVKSERKKLVDPFRLRPKGGKYRYRLNDANTDWISWTFLMKATLKQQEIESNSGTEDTTVNLSEADDENDDSCEHDHANLNKSDVTKGSQPHASSNKEIEPAKTASTSDVNVVGGQPSTPTSNNQAIHMIPLRRPHKTDSPLSWQKHVISHMDKVVRLLAQPLETSTSTFLKYLKDVLASVPDNRKRQCQQMLLKVANAYADGNENTIGLLN